MKLQRRFAPARTEVPGGVNFAGSLGVKLSIHAVGGYLARWGYALHKPLNRAYSNQ